MAKNNKSCFFYLYDKTWVFDQSKRAQGPIYIIKLHIERFSSNCPKTNTKEISSEFSSKEISSMKQSEFHAITCNLLKEREKSCVQGAIGFASHWLKS